MWKKKSIAVVFTGLLIFALFVSGGCLGDGDSNNSSQKLQKMAVIGKLTDEDVATLKEENIELVSYSKENLQKTRAVLIAVVDSLTDEQKADIKQMFAENKPAVVSVYEPVSAEKITTMKTILFGAEDKDRAILKEDSLATSDTEHIRVYSVMRDKEGNIHSYAGILHDLKSKFDSLQRDDSICAQCVNAGKVTLRYNEKKGCYDLVTYEVVETKDNQGTVTEKYVKEKSVVSKGTDIDITKHDAEGLKATIDGVAYDCVSIVTKDKAYQIYEEESEHISHPTHKYYECELKSDDKDTNAAELTPAEKIAKARELGIKQFVEWLRSEKSTKQQMLVDSGYIKPKTRFEKFMAWTKDLLGSTGIAFADQSQVNLYNVASYSTGTVGSTFTTLAGFSMSVYNTIVGVHQFEGTGDNDGKDIYYIGEACKFTNNLTSPEQRHWYEHGSYSSEIAKANNDSHKYYPNGADCEEGYIGSYKVVTQVKGLKSVECPLSQPDTYNNVTTKTVSHASNIGAGISGGVEVNSSGNVAGKIGLCLSGGYTSEDSETYSTADIEAIEHDNSYSSGYIQINHNVTKTPVRGPTGHWTQLTESADLAKSTYGPIHKFIWRILTANRSSATGYNVKVTAGMCGAYSKYSGSQNPEYYTMYPSFSADVAFVMPPRFCIEKDTVNFDENTGKTDYVKIFSQGAWTYTLPDDCKWLELTWSDTNKQLTIAADSNNTGATRTAVITLKRTNGTEGFDSRTITVTQSKYSK